MITLKILDIRFRWIMFWNRIRLSLLGRRVNRLEKQVEAMK